MPEEVKRCTACKKEKPLGRFWSEKLRRHVSTCGTCRDAHRRWYWRNRAQQCKEEPLRGRRPGESLLSGELADEHDLLGLPPATLTVTPARPRPCDAGQRWLAIV
jgi:hypothetical protein